MGWILALVVLTLSWELGLSNYGGLLVSFTFVGSGFRAEFQVEEN